MSDPINVAEIPEVPDLLLARARSLASRLPDPCEGSRGHLAMMDVQDFETDLHYIRTEPTHLILQLKAGGYYNMDDLLRSMTTFILNHKDN